MSSVTPTPIPQASALTRAVADGFVSDTLARRELAAWASVDALAQDKTRAYGAIQAFDLFSLLFSRLEYEPGNPVAVLDTEVVPSLSDDIRGWLASLPASQDKYLVLNSPGGSAVTGVAVANMLKRDGNVTISVHGQAFSAASLILQGGALRCLMPGATCGIHRSWVLTAGNSESLRQSADQLDTMDAGMLDIYREGAGAKYKEDEIVELMRKESMLTPAQAIELGLADESVSVCPTQGMRMPNAKEDEDTGEDDKEMQASAPAGVNASPREIYPVELYY